MARADPDLVTKQAKQRGHDQFGTLGSGNHFLEVQYVDEIYDAKAAQAFGLAKYDYGHDPLRFAWLGHQTCTDYVREMMKTVQDFGYLLALIVNLYARHLPPKGQDYFAAMIAAANFAWANRHVIAHWVRERSRSLGKDDWLAFVYDVSHNIGKKERHLIDGNEEMIMHRKGATRAFGPGRPETPAKYRAIGQPVLIPGTMGTASYVLAGTKKAWTCIWQLVPWCR